MTAVAPSPAPFVSFTFEDVAYSIPAADEWSLDAIEAFEDGKSATLIREILGAKQWATFKEKPRKVSDLTALFVTIEKAVNAGN